MCRRCRPRGGERPGEVLPAPDQHVAGERGGGRAAYADVRPVEAHLERQARVVVGDLRAAREHRRARRRALAGDEQDVRRLRVLQRRSCRGLARQLRPPALERALLEPDEAARSADRDLRLLRRGHGAGRRRLRVVAAAQVRVDPVAAPPPNLSRAASSSSALPTSSPPPSPRYWALIAFSRVDVAAVDGSRDGAVAAVPEVDAREVGVDVVQHLPALRAGAPSARPSGCATSARTLAVGL